MAVSEHPSTPDHRRRRAPHPRGFEPGVRYEASEPVEVTVTVQEIPEDEARWRAAISDATGLSIPDGREVELTQVRYWGDKDAPMIYCRFSIPDREAAQKPALDVVGLLRDIRAVQGRKIASRGAGPGAFVLSWADWQIGKGEGGGSEATAGRVIAALHAARRRVQELRAAGRRLGHLVIVGGGDLVEGCAMFPSHAYTVDLDRRAQVRAVVELGLSGLDLLAPLFDRVTVLAVPGNHGENRVNGTATSRADNDDVAVFEHMAQAAARDKRLSHVDFVISGDELSKTLEVAGWTLGATHGHVYGKTYSAVGVEPKVWRWFSQQAAGRLPVGDSDVLLTHHYHHFAARDWGACLWLQTPAMDGGSAWFSDVTGQAARPGMLSFIMAPESRCSDLLILE